MVSEEDSLRNKLKLFHIMTIVKELDISPHPIYRFAKGGDIKHSYYVKIRDYFENLEKSSYKQS